MTTGEAGGADDPAGPAGVGGADDPVGRAGDMSGADDRAGLAGVGGADDRAGLAGVDGDTAGAAGDLVGGDSAAGEAAARAAKARRLVKAADRPLSRGERVFYQVARVFLLAIAGSYWRIGIEGRAYVPKEGAFVLAPVHRSNIDTVLMPFVTRRQLRYMAKDSLWRHGWSAWLLTALGGFPVNRETADRESLRTCEAALRRGEGVVIFPEGTRKTGAIVTNLFEGAAFVALRNGVPIVPVGIGGSARAMPRGAKYVRPVKIRLMIGAPIQPPPRSEAGARGRRSQVHELTQRLQQELQRLYDRAEGLPLN